MQFHGQDMPVVDTHADSLGAVLRGERNLYERSEKGQLDFPRMQEGGHTLQFFSLWVEPENKPERAMSRLMQYLDAFWTQIGAHSEWIRPVLDRESLEALLRDGGIGGVPSIEGAEGVGTDPAMVRILHRLGVRLMSLTWNERNALADGAGEEPGGGGVSRAGRAIIQEMNRVNIIVDVSHIAEAGFWDVLEISSRPVIASHSNCRELQNHRRNLSDAQIRALAAQGGIQGITFVRPFLGGSEDLERVVDHILHALAVVGTDRHLGLGSDFDGVDNPVGGLEDVTQLPRLAQRMSDRGLSDDSIRRILGYNYIDFLRNTWA
ncbi:dipeptidase [Sulfobacillus harzensis]|uniref:Membrane dipeptidase n=1 Tax=Sulfobacillus harzensis TaxID=2729629 RepID=A0A7Y0Q1H0_9FIRM|nr:dipeptidase [Sulfobacillus harzensis]NMP20821.1 membrane dipeptidase [Sulfobacillus harzensis]